LNLSSTYERKKCSVCLSEPDLLIHLTWCPPISPLTFKPHGMSFFLVAEHIYIYISHIFFIHSSVVGHFSCFHSLAIVNGVVINISIQMSLLYPDLCSFG
jgi:hypothetical protein